jgi:hypothetical protein
VVHEISEKDPPPTGHSPEAGRNLTVTRATTLATATAWDLDRGGNQQLTALASSCGCRTNLAEDSNLRNTADAPASTCCVATAGQSESGTQHHPVGYRSWSKPVTLFHVI